MVDVTKKAKITVVCGSSGSGKSAWVKNQIAKEGRLLIWDVDDEYASITKNRVTSIPELTQLLRKAGNNKPLCARLVAQGEGMFNLFCASAFTFGACTVVAEETADVTSPGKAPAGWGQLVRRGRKRGITIYAVTQRPAESDKTVIGNATEIHCGMLARANDRAYMAREMDIPETDIAQLLPLEFWHRDLSKRSITKGKLSF